MLVALLPAVITARPNLQPLLRQSRTTDTPARRRALGMLVAVQIGLAVVLGIGSMLMLRSMWNLQRVDPGFDPKNVLTFRLQTTSKYRDMTRGAPYLQQITDRVKALPGVIDAGLVGHLPMSGYSWTMGVQARRSAAGARPAGAECRLAFHSRRLFQDDAHSDEVRADVHGCRPGRRAGGGDRQRDVRAQVFR